MAEGQSFGAVVSVGPPLFSAGSSTKRSSRFQASGLEVGLLSRSTRTSYVPASLQVVLDPLPMVRCAYAAIGRGVSPEPKVVWLELHRESSRSRMLTVIPSPYATEPPLFGTATAET